MTQKTNEDSYKVAPEHPDTWTVYFCEDSDNLFKRNEYRQALRWADIEYRNKNILMSQRRGEWGNMEYVYKKRS